MKEFFKNLGRYKVSSTLNILGLGIAFAAAYAILVQVNYDFGFNRSLKDSERVFRLEQSLFTKWNGGKMSAYLTDPLGQAFGEDTSMVESFGRMNLYPSELDIKINVDGKEDSIQVKSSWGTFGAPETMGFNLISGSFDRLAVRNNILMSEKLAKAYGLQLDDVVVYKPYGSLTIVGIFEDFADNCDLNGIQMYIPITADQLNKELGHFNYVYHYKLKSEDMADAFLESLYPKLYEYEKRRGSLNDTVTYASFRTHDDHQLRLTSINKTYLSEATGGGKNGNATTTYTLLVIAVVIVVIAFVNFINFFMAMVPRRIRRVNTEKIFGCTASRLRLGFVGEAVGLVLLGLLLGALIIFYIAPEVRANSFIITSIALEDNWDVVSMMFAAGILFAIIASIYPAYYITSVPPAFAIKGSFGNTIVGRRLRNVLLGFQFLIALILIICTLFIKSQHKYMMNYDMGFDKECLLSTRMDFNNAEITNQVNSPAFISLLKENPMIKDVTFMDRSIVSETKQVWGTKVKGEDDREVHVQMLIVPWNFLRVMGIEITEGRDFESYDEQNPHGTIIYSETARRKYNLTMDTKIDWNHGISEVAGFCKDITCRPLQYAKEPFAFFVYGGKHPWSYLQCYVRTTENADIEAVKAHIADCIVKLSPKTDRESIKTEFYDEELGYLYEKEKELTRLVTVFSFVAILIALMGVFGLVFFETQYRRREIAVRRVHGASIKSILGMFVGQYARMVGIAFLFAVPVSYLIMHRWLQSFAYHIPLHWWVFALALLIVLAVTSAIVLARSWRAARENPVNSLYKE